MAGPQASGGESVTEDTGKYAAPAMRSSQRDESMRTEMKRKEVEAQVIQDQSDVELDRKMQMLREKEAMLMAMCVVHPLLCLQFVCACWFGACVRACQALLSA